MMDWVINRLYFMTNTGKILAHIRSRNPQNGSPLEFSLNSITAMPEELLLPLAPHLIELSALNIAPVLFGNFLKKTTREKALLGQGERTPEAAIQERIDSLEKALPPGEARDHFTKAVSNYRQHGFFYQYDWRFAHWGTIEDICSVTPETFHPDTSFIEFATRHTPPLAALRKLADTFPSVRFKLKYRCSSGDDWMCEDIFPVTPWGY